MSLEALKMMWASVLCQNGRNDSAARRAHLSDVGPVHKASETTLERIVSIRE